MGLHGEIRLMPLTDIFQWLELRVKTGVLEIGTEATEYRFYLSEGKLVTATSPRYHTTDCEANVRYLLTDALRLTEGTYSFSEGKLPEEMAAVELRLDAQQLFTDIFQQPDFNAEVSLALNAAVGGSARAAQPFRPAEALRLAIIDRLILDDYKLPLLPHVVKKVMEITQRENYSLGSLSNVIMTDQTLAAQLLKQANSSAWAGEREINSIRAAIQRLGAQAVVNLTPAISLHSAGQGRDIFLRQRKQIWQHSLACALMARNLAQLLRAEAETAFLCALLMDFGRLVLLSLIQDVMKSDARLQRAPVGIIDEILESYHCQVGGETAEKWMLPTPVCEAITCHHSPSSARQHSTLAAIASLSDTLVTHCAQAENVANHSDLTAAADQLSRLPAAAMLNLSVAQLKTILEHGPESLKFAREFLLM
jgi:HD-like signal output (HDOD) protein